MPEPIELLPPGCGPADARWHELRRAGVTASEIAAVMGLSPWDSPFSLYWKKLNGWGTEESAVMSAGRYVEPSAADWWIAENDPLENMVLAPAGLYASAERPWQLATPDRLILGNECSCYAVGDVLCSCLPNMGPLLALLECKWVAHSWDGWGEPGTDDIPVYYRAQTLWQADTLGVDTVYVAALGPGGFRAYVVHVDDRAEEDLRLMRAAGQIFLTTIRDGDAPDVDSHTATAGALQRLYPEAGSGEVEVSLELAERYRLARLDRDAAKDRVALCEAEIRAALGSEYSRAIYGKRLVASRSIFERRTDDEHELMAIDDAWPTTDRLNPGKKLEIPYAS